MLLTLQKIYFVFAISYIVYFFFTVNRFKYKVLTNSFRGTHIVFMVIIALIISVFLIYGIKKKIVYSKNNEWKVYNPTENHVVKKKRDLIIREALHKTYKWREYFNGFLKLLQSPKSLSVEKARELVAFLYGSNFLKTEGNNADDDTKIDKSLESIIGLESDGMIDPEFTGKTISDDNKNKLIGFILKKIYKDDNSLTNGLIPNSKGIDFFKDLKTNLPKEVIIGRLKYFIDGTSSRTPPSKPLPLFDTVFTALGGRNIYKTELSEFNEAMIGGSDSGARSPQPRDIKRAQLRRFSRSNTPRRSVTPGPRVFVRDDSSDSLGDPLGANIISGVPALPGETQERSQTTAAGTSQSNIEEIGTIDAQVRPLGPVRPAEPDIVDNDEDPDIIKPPKVPHFWGYGVTQNSLYTGNPLKKPLLKALDIIKTWIPVNYEFYDVAIPDDYVESKGGGLGPELTNGEYNKGTIISSRGAGFLNPEKEPEQITLNRLVNNDFESGRIIVDSFNSEKKTKYNNLNKVVTFLKNIIIDLKINYKDKKVKRVELKKFIKKLIKSKKEITNDDKSYLVYLIIKQLYPDSINTFPTHRGIVSERDIQVDNSILSIIKETVSKLAPLPRSDPDQEDETEFTNYHMTNYFKNMLDKVRSMYENFTDTYNGYTNYPPWLKNNSLIKMKTHRDVAKHIKVNYRSFGSGTVIDDSKIETIYDPKEIMGDNKAGGRPQEKNKEAYLIEKLKLYNIPTNTQSGGAASGQSSASGEEDRRVKVPNIDNWLPDRRDDNLTYENLKEDINIDSLNKDPGEVSNSDKQKYSSTNYKYNKLINDFMIGNDYYNEFLKFAVYFGNINIFIILFSIRVIFLNRYKSSVIQNNNNITNYDKNIFNDQINKHTTYIRAFLWIFVVIFIFSFKSVKKYGLLFIKLVISLLSDISSFIGGIRGREVVQAGGASLSDDGDDDGDDDTSFISKIINVFKSLGTIIGNSIPDVIKNNKTYTILIVISAIVLILFSLPSFITKPSKQEDRITNLFVKDLSRSKKIQEGDVKPQPIYEKKGEYICYNNTCTNNSLSIKNQENKVKKYGGEPNNIKKFKNLKDCKNSGCETIGNSGVAAVKYSITKK